MNLLSNPDLLLYNKQKNKETSPLILHHTLISTKCFVLDHNYFSTTTTLLLLIQYKSMRYWNPSYDTTIQETSLHFCKMSYVYCCRSVSLGNRLWDEDLCVVIVSESYEAEVNLTCGEWGGNKIDWGRSWQVVGSHRQLWRWEGPSWGSEVGQRGSMLSSPQLWAIRKVGWFFLAEGSSQGGFSWELGSGRWCEGFLSHSLQHSFTACLSQNIFRLSSNHILDVYCKLLSPESQQQPSSGQGTFQNNLEGEKKGKY